MKIKSLIGLKKILAPLVCLVVLLAPSFLLSAVFAEIANKAQLDSVEVILSVKSASGIYESFVNSRFISEFQKTKLMSRYDETIIAAKITQLKASVLSTFGSNISYSKLVSFFDCPADFYFINSDFDALAILLSLNRDISKFEYFVKLKKGLAVQKADSTNIYVISSEDGVESLYFCGFNSRTYFSNDIEILKSIIEKKVSFAGIELFAAPLSAYINLNKLNARLTAEYKKIGAHYIYMVSPFKNASELKLMIFNGPTAPNEAEYKKAEAAFDIVNLPKDVPFFAAISSGFSVGAFFSAAYDQARRFEFSTEFNDCLKALSETKSLGFKAAINENTLDQSEGNNSLFSGAAIALCLSHDSVKQPQIEIFKRYLAPLYIDYQGKAINFSNISPDKFPAAYLQWLDSAIKSLGAGAYLYYFRFDAVSERLIKNFLGAVLDFKSWHGSSAYEFTFDLRESLEAFNAIEYICAIRPSAGGILNSIIKIRLR